MRLLGFRLRRWFNSGQPTFKTHPHLVKEHELWPGIQSGEFRERRKRLFALILESEASVILRAAPVKYASQNIFYRYHQDPSFLYLSAWNEPDAAIVLEKSGKNEKYMLFMTEQTKESKLWEGERNDKKMAKEVFGADFVYDLKELEEYRKSFRGKVYEEAHASEMIHSLRVIKSSSEIELMRKAAKIAASSFESLNNHSVHSLGDEAVIETLFEYECRKRGAQGLSYVPVVAGGPRGLIIHYTRNDQRLNPEEGVLIDAGCRFHGYCSDVTRSFPPVTSEKLVGWRKIYDAVAKVQRLCVNALSFPGSHRNLMSMNLLANHLFMEELDNLGFRDPRSCVQELFPHSVGHYLGMDVHDCPSVSVERDLEPGMVVTVEPGLYIPPDPRYPREFWNVAVRIEDDVLIKEEGVEILSEN